MCASVQSAGGNSQEARSSTYDGEFRDGKMHGRGSLTWGDGKRFMGDFRDNCLHGYGVFESPDDWTYTGALEFDRPTKGVFTGKDRIRYAVVYAKNCDFIWNQPTPETMKPDPSYLNRRSNRLLHLSRMDVNLITLQAASTGSATQQSTADGHALSRPFSSGGRVGSIHC